MRANRSLFNFAILVVVATATAIFVHNKAREAMNEIDRISTAPVYLGKRNLDTLKQ